MAVCSRCGEDNADKARFCWSCGNALATGPSAEVRKTVTVMFTDVVGSTGLGERTDPESLRTVMTRYFDEIRAIVERHGGTVEKYIGDAVMAVFGVPVVHEDDALRAVRAAVAVRARLAGLGDELERERGVALRWRTGINTGEVVAGDVGSGQRFVSGDAVNVAARLQQAAQTDEVLIGRATYELVVGDVIAESVGGLTVKGKADALEAYRLGGLAMAESAGHRARHLRAAMIGRERQLRLLTDAFEQVVSARRCHLFTILGSAGVGKSRLTREFLASIASDATVLRGRCLSYGEGITYWPIAEIVRDAAGINGPLGEHELRATVGSLIDDERDRAQAVHGIHGLIGQSATGVAKDETFWAVRTLLESLGRRRPVIVVIDDLHWAEPSLLDMVDYLADWLTDAPVLLVVLARRDLLDVRPGWAGGKANASTVTLDPLGADQSRELVLSLLGDADVTGHVGERIVQAADGNPLFVEEMLEMLIDRGVLIRENDRWHAVGDLSVVSIPPTIQALLAARIDGLGRTERVVLERASVEGQVFHRSAVAQLSPADLEPSVGEGLLSLTRKELVRPDRSDARQLRRDDSFRFRHLLIRDAAYAAMPKALRADLHARFAEWLRVDAGDSLVELEEILGYHYEQAYLNRVELGMNDAETQRLAQLVGAHLGSAGQRALDRGDISAAQKLLGSATDVLAAGDLMHTRLTADRAIALRMAGDIEQAERVAAAAEAAARDAGDEAGHAHVAVVRIGLEGMLGRRTVASAVEELQGFLATLRRHGEDRAIDQATFGLATEHFFAGHAALAQETLSARMAERGNAQIHGEYAEWLVLTALIGPTHVEVVSERISEILNANPNRSAQAFITICLGALQAHAGRFEAGRDLIRQGEEVMRGLGRQVLAAADAGGTLLQLELLAGDLAEAVRVGTAAFATLSDARENGYAATIAGILSQAHFEFGQLQEAEEYARLASELTSSDDIDAQARSLRTRARVAAGRGDVALATNLAEEATAMVEPTDYLDLRGGTFADLAEIRLIAGDTAGAAEALKTARGNYTRKGFSVEEQRIARRLQQIAPTA